MNKRFWLPTTAAALMSTGAFAQSGTKETPSAAPSAHQERSSEQPDAAPPPQSQSPSAESDTQSSQASRPATTPRADGASSGPGPADRRNAEGSSKTKASDNTWNKRKEGAAAQEDTRPDSERAQSKVPASGQRRSNNPDGAVDRSRQSTAKDAAAPDRRDARSPNEDGRRNAEGASDRGRADASTVKIDDRQRTRLIESVLR
jgi:hypothetical protein